MKEAFSFKDNLVALEKRHAVYVSMHARAKDRYVRADLALELFHITAAIIYNKQRLLRRKS